MKTKIFKSKFFPNGKTNGLSSAGRKITKGFLSLIIAGTMCAPLSAQNEPSVYICGSDDQAAYWKNGEKTMLHAMGADWSTSSAKSIFVANNKVYACGDIKYSQYNYAGLWVVDEGTGTITETQLTPDKTSSLVYSVFVSGNDVYVSGYDNRAGYYPVCWKNNVPMALNMGDRTGVFGFAYSVYVSGNDVYVAGTIQTPPVIEAVYWKNSDAPVVLSSSTGGQAGDPANNITANSIYVSGNDVYACGNNETKPVYWKNGVAVQLPGATDAYSIFVYGNDVYVAGAVYGSFQAGYQAVYWKNGVKIALDDINNLGRLVSYTSSIYVKNGDVYIAGYENGQSVYWKNGELIHLPLTSPGTQSSNSATGIFVK